jgi:hypothetical protein
MLVPDRPDAAPVRFSSEHQAEFLKEVYKQLVAMGSGTVQIVINGDLYTLSTPRQVFFIKGPPLKEGSNTFQLAPEDSPVYHEDGSFETLRGLT